jgi:hypothetical protein
MVLAAFLVRSHFKEFPRMSHRRSFGLVSAAAIFGALTLAPAAATAADESFDRAGWTGSFAMYSWLPWLSGDIGVKSVDIDVDVGPDDILSSLDWSTLPVWMSYGELRNGRLTLFNDIMWTALEAGAGFEGFIGPDSVQVDYTQLTVELGAAYAVWSQGGSTIDVLAGGRYWRQETDVFVGGMVVALERSGSVDWVDPFVGARLQQTVAPGQTLLVRGDVGGFGAGSDFSWQAMATFNMELCETGGHRIDGYLGYRALSVDYSEGAYSYDVLQHGPIMGLTMKF